MYAGKKQCSLPASASGSRLEGLGAGAGQERPEAGDYRLEEGRKGASVAKWRNWPGIRLPGSKKRSLLDGSASALLDPKRNTLPIAALLIALTVALFSPAMRYGFLNYDDDAYVYDNPQVPKGLSGPGLHYALTTRDIGTWAPMTWISYEWTPP
jgi:hypothetical protein